MKRLLLFIPLVLTVILTACGDATESVQSWFLSPTVSNISYNLDGVTGSAVFTYYSENNNKILFTSGEGLEGVEFTFADSKLMASRPEDSLEWEASADMAQTLAVFGQLYSYASTLTYTSTPSNTQGEGKSRTVSQTFEYTNGSLTVTFGKTDGKPAGLYYTCDGKSVRMDITDIEFLTQKEGK